MASVTTTTPILSSIFSAMQTAGYTPEQLQDVIDDINGSPLLVSQILSLPSGWQILYSGDPKGGDNTAGTTITISRIDGGDGTAPDPATFVGVLAHEMGHAEDPQINTISYGVNALAVGAETALELLSEGKAQTNNIRVSQSSGFVIPIIADTSNTAVNNAIAAQKADIAANNFSQAVIDGADSYLYEVPSGTTYKNYVSYYWNSALSGLTATLSSSTPSDVMADLKSLNMDNANGLSIKQETNGTDTITITFSTGTISSYIDNFGNYGAIAASDTSGGQGSPRDTSPSPDGVSIFQEFNLTGGKFYLEIFNPSFYKNTITNFVPGDTVDLAGVGTATAATLGTNNVLDVQGLTGGDIDLQLDSGGDYSKDTFVVKSDGAGGTDVTVATQQDFAFVIDTTGSMTPYIDGVKNDIDDIIKAAFGDDGTTDTRIGVVSFKDQYPGGDGGNAVLLPFTNQPNLADREQAAVNAIDAITVGGGGDTPEADYSGLLLALDGSMGEWRASAQVRKIILFTDAPVKQADIDAVKATVDQYAHDLNTVIVSHPVSAPLAAGGHVDSFVLAAPAGDDQPIQVQIYTIQVGDDPSATDTVEQIADDNDGQFFQSPTGTELVQTVLKILTAPTVAVPTALALSPLSDTGTKGDNVTTDATPIITGDGVAGDTVTLLDGDTPVGTGIVDFDGTWNITASTLAPGDHTLTATEADADDNRSLSSVPLDLKIVAAPSVPANLALDPASDSGVKGDDITNVTTPAITGTGDKGDTVTLLDGTVQVGMAIVGFDETWSITTTPLATGDHTLTATETDAYGDTSGPSGALDLTIQGTTDTGAIGPTGPYQTFVFSGDHKHVEGTPGNDVIWGAGSFDTIEGGHNDLFGLIGDNNQLTTDAGSTVWATGSGNTISGGNLIVVFGDNNSISGGAGGDTIWVVGSGNTVAGGAGTNTIGAVGNDNAISGGPGTATLYAYGANDTVSGGGTDQIYLGGMDQTFLDTAGVYHDTVTGFSVALGDAIRLTTDTVADALAHTTQINGGQDTQIDLSDGSTIVLKLVSQIDGSAFA